MRITVLCGVTFTGRCLWLLLLLLLLLLLRILLRILLRMLLLLLLACCLRKHHVGGDQGVSFCLLLLVLVPVGSRRCLGTQQCNRTRLVAKADAKRSACRHLVGGLLSSNRPPQWARWHKADSGSTQGS